MQCYLSSQTKTLLLTMTYKSNFKSPPINDFQYQDPIPSGFGGRIFVLLPEELLPPEPDPNFPPEILPLDAVGKGCVPFFPTICRIPWPIDGSNVPR